jgi:hypothetical protein
MTLAKKRLLGHPALCLVDMHYREGSIIEEEYEKRIKEKVKIK